MTVNLTDFLTDRLDETEDVASHIGEEASRLPRWVGEMMLREVEAKRRILAMYEEQGGYTLPDGVAEGRDPDERAADEAAKVTLLDVLGVLAGAYSDHPDYNPAWA